MTFTSLYPSETRPRHGIFVERRLIAIQNAGNVDACVVVPVPWFPFRSARFGDFARYATTPRAELRAGNRVLYPRYPTLPIAGMYLQPMTMALRALPVVNDVRREFDFELIDAHYFYPDAVAAAMVASWMNRPLVITARGSDVNLLTQFSWPRRMILWAARRAEAIVTVSAALKNRLVTLGVDADQIYVVRNGVDTALFAPTDKSVARKRCGLIPDGPLVVSVGNLVPEKGHDLLIDALAYLPDVRLLIVGDGPERARLERYARASGHGGRVCLRRAVRQQELKWLYGAADVVALASTREGLPNVLLEAIACGRPIVASNVGGVPEIVTDPLLGHVVAERSAIAFARAIRDVIESAPLASAIRAFAQALDWDSVGRAQLAVFERAISPRGEGTRRAVRHA